MKPAPCTLQWAPVAAFNVSPRTAGRRLLQSGLRSISRCSRCGQDATEALPAASRPTPRPPGWRTGATSTEAGAPPPGGSCCSSLLVADWGPHVWISWGAGGPADTHHLMRAMMPACASSARLECPLAPRGGVPAAVLSDMDCRLPTLAFATEQRIRLSMRHGQTGAAPCTRPHC